MKSLFRQIVILFCAGILLTANAAENYTNNKSVINLFTEESEEFLPPDQAFKLTLDAIDAQHIQAAFTIAPGYYLYRDRIKFAVKDRPEVSKLVSVDLPVGDMKDDPNFGRMEVYHHDFNANLVIDSANTTPPVITVEASYQGCSEKGLCYAPIKKPFSIDFSKPIEAKTLVEVNKPAAQRTSGNVSNDAITTRLLKDGDLWLIIAGFFGAGLLLSLTPCVLPMIPILSSIIVGQRANQSIRKWQAFGLSVAYVLGMALSYTLAGIAAGLSGNLLSQSLQNPWVLGSFALLFVILACSMFGLYEIRLPAAFESKVVNITNRFKGGKFLGVFVMGALSALIVSPCVAAPLAGALIYIGQSQDVFLGGIALFSLSLGMGVPLLMLGASAGSILPKAGNWMNLVRNFFGVVMLGMAIWLISPVIPHAAVFVLWGALSIVLAIFMNALDPLPTRASIPAKLGKGIAIILLVTGIALLVGALSGAKTLWQPLQFSSMPSVEQKLTFTRVTSLADLDSKIANAQGKPVLLDFYADWCVACKEMETFTFSDSKIQQLLKDTVLLQADVTANSEEDKAMLKRFNLFGPPGIIFFDKKGLEISQARTIGFQNVEQFSTTLNLRDQNL